MAAQQNIKKKFFFTFSETPWVELHFDHFWEYEVHLRVSNAYYNTCHIYQLFKYIKILCRFIRCDCIHIFIIYLQRKRETDATETNTIETNTTEKEREKSLWAGLSLFGVDSSEANVWVCFNASFGLKLGLFDPLLLLK